MQLLFCCGGTAGHIHPALAIAAECRKRPDCRIAFAGRASGMEATLVKKAGYPFYEIEIQGLQRRITLQNLTLPIALSRAARRAREIIADCQPDLLFGTGGYVCWPLLRQGQKLGIPTVLHESNSVPGIAVKLLAPHCEKVLLGIAECGGYLRRKDNLVMCGNPTGPLFRADRKNYARQKLGIPTEAFLAVSFGGSLGAQRLNEAVIGYLSLYGEKRENYYHLHASGKRYYEDILRQYPSLTKKEARCRVTDYIANMGDWLCAADIAICRAGAMTLAETAAAGCVPILVPSPNVTGNHQLKNALAWKEAGAGILLEEKALSPDTLRQCIDRLSDTAERGVFRRKLLTMATPDAAHTAASEICAVAKIHPE